MITETIYIPNLTTQEDTSVLRQILIALEAVKHVSFDLPAKRLVISYAEDRAIHAIKQTIEESGYHIGQDLGIYPKVRRKQYILS